VWKVWNWKDVAQRFHDARKVDVDIRNAA